MKRYLIVTITCQDRPGIVEQVTDVVVAHGGNWEESRLARLGGDFAGIVMVGVSAERADELKKSLATLSGDQMNVTGKETSPEPTASREAHTLCSLRLEGADHEGIVHDVAAYLAGRGVNVESMETEVGSAPMSAAPLFHMQARLNVPPSLTVDELRKELLPIGEQLGVEIAVEV